MNVNRARGGDDDFGDVGDEPTMPAKYAGTCRTCGQRFAVGDPIASVLVDKKMTYHHGACRYPATALLAHDNTEVDVDPETQAREAIESGKVPRHDQQGQAVQQHPAEGRAVLRSASEPARYSARPLVRSVDDSCSSVGGSACRRGRERRRAEDGDTAGVSAAVAWRRPRSTRSAVSSTWPRWRPGRRLARARRVTGCR